MFSNRVFLLIFIINSSAFADRLSFDDLDDLASVHAYQAVVQDLNSKAFSAVSIANSQFDDPKLTMGIFNLPVDGLSITDQPTTQFRFGVKQQLPRGSSLTHKKNHQEKLAKAAAFQSASIHLNVSRMAKVAFLGLIKAIRVTELLESNYPYIEDLVSLTENKYGNGLASQQEVIHAKLKLLQIDKQLIKWRNQQQIERSSLSRWIGDKAWNEIETTGQNMSVISNSDITDSLRKHPKIMELSAMIEASEEQLSTAVENSKSSWNLGFEYRKRFGEETINQLDRSDMLAVTATVDLPIRRKNKQHQRIQAASLRLTASEQKRKQLYFSMLSDYKQLKAQYQSISEQLNLLKASTIIEVNKNQQAALHSYQSDSNDYTTYIVAQLAILETEMNIIDLSIEQKIISHHLAYFTYGKDEQL